MEILLRLDDFRLAMVEQPLPADDLVGHAMVQESLRTPLCLDEGVTTVDQAAIALELHSGRFVNLKPGRVGGLTPAMAIHDACREGSVPCWVGAMPQSSIGARLGYALAAKSNCTYPSDLSPSPDLLAEDARLEPTGEVLDRPGEGVGGLGIGSTRPLLHAPGPPSPISDT